MAQVRVIRNVLHHPVKRERRETLHPLVMSRGFGSAMTRLITKFGVSRSCPNLPADMLKDFHPLCHQHRERPDQPHLVRLESRLCRVLATHVEISMRSPTTRSTIIAFPGAADALPAAA
jgi:hypothetical protein